MWLENSVTHCNCNIYMKVYVYANEGPVVSRVQAMWYKGLHTWRALVDNLFTKRHHR